MSKQKNLPHGNETFRVSSLSKVVCAQVRVQPCWPICVCVMVQTARTSVPVVDCSYLPNPASLTHAAWSNTQR